MLTHNDLKKPYLETVLSGFHIEIRFPEENLLVFELSIPPKLQTLPINPPTLKLKFVKNNSDLELFISNAIEIEKPAVVLQTNELGDLLFIEFLLKCLKSFFTQTPEFCINEVVKFISNSAETALWV